MVYRTRKQRRIVRRLLMADALLAGAVVFAYGIMVSVS